MEVSRKRLWQLIKTSKGVIVKGREWALYGETPCDR